MPHQLYRLVSETQKEEDFGYLKEFSYSSIINIYYWVDKNIKTSDFVALLGVRAQWLFNRRNFVTVPSDIKEQYPGLINVTISSANEFSDISSEELVAETFAEVQRCIPAFADVKILHHKVIKEKFATFSAGPKIEKIRPLHKTSIKRLFIAGDWTNTGLPATIESASNSGKATAQEIIKQHI